MSHSPLPWRITGAGNIQASNGAIVFVGRTEDETTQADAEFIVLACNVYEGLLAACKDAENYITHERNWPLGTRIAQRPRALASLRIAISKAESK